MSNSNEERARGAFIIPSARRSIHSYKQTPLNLENNMNRYGLVSDSDDNESEQSGNEEGPDEVDSAVLSKLLHPIALPSAANKNGHRRNSFCAENLLTEDDATNVLSTSVPAKLPSQFNYSNDSDDEQPTRNEYQHSDVSFHSIATPNRSNTNTSGGYVLTPPVFESSRFMHTDGNQNNSSIFTYISLAGVLVTLCISMLSTSDMSNNSNYDEFKFYTDVVGFGEKYNVDENSILQVQTGISTIFEKEDTGSFMFVYNSNSNNFNSIDFNKFIDDVSVAASKYLRNDSTPVHYTIVEGTKLDMEEHGELIARYREDLHRTGVMLVRHIEAIPSELAMDFHFYCDEYNPLVKKSAIFFTLNLAKCPQESDNKSSHASIEKCLSKKWNSVPVESIGPLLTRVVSVVIDVTTAF